MFVKISNKALQTLFRGDNRVSQCFTVFFCSSELLRLFCIINTLHVEVDYLIIYLLCRILGGGGALNFFLEGWTFCLGAYS